MNMDGMINVFKEVLKEKKIELPDLSKFPNVESSREEIPGWGGMEEKIPDFSVEDVSLAPKEADEKRDIESNGPEAGQEKNPEGKTVFYNKVDKDLEENGYKTIPEKDLTQGKGEHQYTKPGDGIAIKGNTAIAVEKKALAETSQSGAGLKRDYIGNTRADVNRRVAAGDISKDVGLHETKLAQAEYNAHNLKDGVTGTKANDAEIKGKTIKPGYSVERSEGPGVEKALANRNITNYEKIEGSNGSITYVWDLPPKPPSGKW